MTRQSYKPSKKSNKEEQYRTRHLVGRKSMTTGTHTREICAKFVWGNFKEMKRRETAYDEITAVNDTKKFLFLGGLDDKKDDIEVHVITFEPAEGEKRFFAPAITRNFLSRRPTKSDLKFGGGKLSMRSVAITPITPGESEKNTNNKINDGKNDKIVQILMKGVWVIKRLAPNVCEATIVNRIEDTGSIPKMVFNMNIGRSLGVIYDLKGYFERNDTVVDKELRNEFIVSIPRAIVTNRVTEIVEEQMSKVNVIDDKWVPLPKDSNTFVKLSKMHLEGKNINVWGKSETIIDTSAEEVLAYFWDYCSNERIKATKNLEKNPRELVKTIAPNHLVLSTIKHLPWPLNNLQFLYENTWLKKADGSYVYSWRPPATTEFDDNRLIDIGKNKQSQLTRAESRGFAIISKYLDSDSCKIVLCSTN